MIELARILTPEAILLLKEKDGVYACLHPDFENRLNHYLPAFEKIRKAEGAKIYFEPSMYPQLPFGQRGFEWKFRQQSWAVIKTIIETGASDIKHPLSILEMGSFNGWLANRLAGMGHQVLATDYFRDARDGLQSKNYYSNTWTAMQMDLADPSIFKPGTFDIIIINHGLQFMPHATDYIAWLKAFLKPGGKIIAAGLSFYKNPSKKEAAIEVNKQRFRDTYQIEMMIHPSKGYLDFNDKKMLEAAGLKTYPYPNMWLYNLSAAFNSQKPQYCYGIFSY